MIKRRNKTAYNREVTETMSAPTAYTLKKIQGSLLGVISFIQLCYLRVKNKFLLESIPYDPRCIPKDTIEIKSFKNPAHPETIIAPG